MQYKSTAVIIAGLTAQQVAAFGWSDASAFSCPGNTNNQCSSSQAGGYDWSGLPAGSFSSYGSNTFSGFTCSNSFGKRDLLNKRGFQQKCITGSLDSNPSISGDNGFSINQMQISSSQDTDIDCEYSMPDGSTCTESHSCSQGGSIFQNSQCGGAKSVTFKPGKNAPSGCSIGVHSVGFHCGPPASTVPASVPPTSPPASTPPASTPPASTPPASTAPSYTCQGPQCSSPTVPIPSASSPSESSPPTCSGAGCSSGSAVPPATTPCYGGSCTSTVPVVPSGSAPPTSPSSPVQSVPTSECVGPRCSMTSPVTSASHSASAPHYPGCSGPTCSGSASMLPSASAQTYSGSASMAQSASVPVYSGSASMGPSASIPVYSGSASMPSASALVPSGSASTQGVPTYGSTTSPVAPVSTSTAPSPFPTPNCPGLLPRCLNTWMYMSGCKDNGQADCFCGNEQFIKNVMGCISAWGGSDSEVQAAASYLMGLCANHVSTNPAIITACPSTITPTPAGFTPSGSAGPITSAPPANSAPCTTITYSSSVVIPATFTTGVSSGLTCPGSSITTSLITTVTVPQVQITTSTVTAAGTTTQSVGLGAGSPSPVPAYTTSAGATLTGAAPTYGTTFGTSFAAAASTSGPPIVPFTGAGATTAFSIGSVLLGAVAALAAL